MIFGVELEMFTVLPDRSRISKIPKPFPYMSYSSPRNSGFRLKLAMVSIAGVYAPGVIVPDMVAFVTAILFYQLSVSDSRNLSSPRHWIQAQYLQV